MSVASGGGWRQLCVYVWGCVYVCIRRRTLSVLVCVGACVVVLLALHWGVICLDTHSRWHVHRVCLDYKSGVSEGSMCEPLCVNNKIEALSCQSYYRGKEAVFAAEWNALPLIFKSPKKSSLIDAEQLHWVDINKNVHYPTEEEFRDMIANNIRIMFNVTVTDSFVRNVSKFHYSPHRVADRRAEMRSLWFLLRDNEYAAMLVYEKHDLFPKLLGSCGPFYATRQLRTLSRFSNLISTDESEEEWRRRVRASILILDYLKKLDSLPDPIRLCDVKLSHFGIDGSTVRYIDLDAVHPASVADALVRPGAPCGRDADCDHLDCRSRCDRATRTCARRVSNNNLQLVCEKVLLGWAGRRVLVPGLLLGVHAPRALVLALQSCANPERVPAPDLPRHPASERAFQQIYNILNSLRMQHLSDEKNLIISN